MAQPTNVMHSRTFAMCHVDVYVFTHIIVRIFSACSRYLRRVGSRALRSIMYQPQMRVYHPRGLQDNDRSMRHARINGPHSYMVYCTHRGPLSLCARSYFPLCRCSSCYHEMHDMYYIARPITYGFKKNREFFEISFY